MIRYPRFGQLKQTDREQRVYDAVSFLQWPVEELTDPGLQTPVPPQTAVAKHSQQRAIVIRNLSLVLCQRRVQRTP